jgi:hypothetical protein
VARTDDHNDSKTPKRIMNYKAEGKKRAGRPKIRWIDIVNTGTRRQVLKTVDSN